MKKTYNVKITSLPVDWEAVDTGYIDVYSWGGEYRPKAYFKAVFVENDGFYVKMTAEEGDPKAVYENDMDPVYKDSCLEFFAMLKSDGYINCEMNSKGAVLAAFGKGRGSRIPVCDIAGKTVEVTANREDRKWSVVLRIGTEIIEKLYGATDISEGFVFKANAYKCGDDCEFPHYGAFSEVGAEKPDYHRPEYFVDFKLVRGE